MEINKKLFYNNIRVDLFKGKLTQGVVDTIESILDSCKRNEVTDKRHIAYILATARHESYRLAVNPEWLPVREGWGLTNKSAISYVTALYNAKKIKTNYALPNSNGDSFYGRGYVQITHPDNYIRLGKRIGIDLFNNPDRALERSVAADLLVIGSKEGLYTGKKLSNYFNTKSDPINARKIINGLDYAEMVADHYDKFLKALIT